MKNNLTYTNIGHTLLILEDTILSMDETLKPNYSKGEFAAGLIIANSVICDAMFNLQEAEEMPIETRLRMGKEFANKFKELIKIYTDIDTIDLYK